MLLTIALSLKHHHCLLPGPMATKMQTLSPSDHVKEYSQSNNLGYLIQNINGKPLSLYLHASPLFFFDWHYGLYFIQGPVDGAVTTAAGVSRRSATGGAACCVAGLWRDSTGCVTHRTTKTNWAGCAGAPHPRAAALSCDDTQVECVLSVNIEELFIMCAAWVNVGEIDIESGFVVPFFFKLVKVVCFCINILLLCHFAHLYPKSRPLSHFMMVSLSPIAILYLQFFYYSS